ncbi:MAG: 3-octaprenyl-4-hydroxybenzoate decarboxylase, partial [Lysobacter sp.]
MSYHDLRSFLSRLENDRQLVRVGVPVDPDLESTALCLRALREGGPALLMERPGTDEAGGAAHALLGNLFGHRDRIEAALAGRPLASLR